MSELRAASSASSSDRFIIVKRPFPYRTTSSSFISMGVGAAMANAALQARKKAGVKCILKECWDLLKIVKECRV